MNVWNFPVVSVACRARARSLVVRRIPFSFPFWNIQQPPTIFSLSISFVLATKRVCVELLQPISFGWRARLLDWKWRRRGWMRRARDGRLLVCAPESFTFHWQSLGLIIRLSLDCVSAEDVALIGNQRASLDGDLFFLSFLRPTNNHQTSSAGANRARAVAAT